MAYITLEPGERFEHIHATESVTRGVDPGIVLQMAGEEILLTPGMEVITPAGVSHVLVNRGLVEARAQCGHR